MAHYQASFMNHFKKIDACLKERGATATILLPGGVLRIQWHNRVYDFQPQFTMRGADKRILMSFDLNPSSTGFSGWLPYFNKRWLESASKRAFKTFAKARGIRTPDYYASPGNYRDVLVKRDQSSFAEGMRGPFRDVTPDSPETAIGEGEYYERFILGKNLKAWFWNGKPACVDIGEMAHAIGDGRHTVRELIHLNLRRAQRGVAPDLLACMVKYQGREIDSVLLAGEKLYVDYRYGSPLIESDSRNTNILAKLNQSLLEQLDNAGRIFEQTIPAEIRNNTVFSADGIVDEQDNIWFLELNCNPGLHPDVYPAMLESLFADADMIPDVHKPLHLQKGQNKGPYPVSAGLMAAIPGGVAVAPPHTPGVVVDSSNVVQQRLPEIGPLRKF